MPLVAINPDEAKIMTKNNCCCCCCFTSFQRFNTWNTLFVQIYHSILTPFKPAFAQTRKEFQDLY